MVGISGILGLIVWFKMCLGLERIRGGDGGETFFENDKFTKIITFHWILLSSQAKLQRKKNVNVT